MLATGVSFSAKNPLAKLRTYIRYFELFVEMLDHFFSGPR
jgi:hypothetical protein